jgi:membrane protein implicated in regulation of membrane protease activity
MWWLFWLVLAVVLGVAEFLTLTLAFGLLAAAALAASVAAGLGAAVPVQLLVFAGTGVIGLVAVRPVARRHLALPPPSRDGSDALVGRSAYVTREVSATGGLVHLSGEDWSARPYDEDLVIPAGVRVDVLQIEGATALVHPREPLPEPLPPDPRLADEG